MKLIKTFLRGSERECKTGLHSHLEKRKWNILNLTNFATQRIL